MNVNVVNKELLSAKDEINSKAPEYKGRDLLNNVNNTSQYETAKNTSKDKANERNRENGTLLEQVASFVSIAENISTNLCVATKGLQYFKAVPIPLKCELEIVSNRPC